VKHRIGFMQGRFSPLIDGRIQAFPWGYWRDEFELAQRHGFGLMEWTLDRERLHENPLMTAAGRAEVAGLRQRHALDIPSLTGDCFMQAPFWKARGRERESLQRDFLAVVDACGQAGVSMIVVPLVDNGRLESAEQEANLAGFLSESTDLLEQRRVRIVFESDQEPDALARFIDRLDARWFGVNYDIGNSAALGYDPEAEFAAYGQRICNVHVKDRRRGGTTVPLGSGDAEFDKVFAALGRVGYAGSCILQTARAADNDHAQALCRYRDMTLAWMSRHGS
jgi:L-ribulose-5-phosphate 3-epimerase